MKISLAIAISMFSTACGQDDKTTGLTVYVDAGIFTAAADAVNQLNLWTVDFSYLTDSPLPNWRTSPQTFSDNSTVGVPRFSIAETAGTSSSSASNIIVAEAPGPNLLASMQIDNDGGDTYSIIIGFTGAPLTPVLAWGARFFDFVPSQGLRFTVSYAGGTPVDFSFNVIQPISFVGLVSTIYPITQIRIEAINTSVDFTFKMDDVRGVLPDAPSSMPSRMPSRKPSSRPSRKPSAKPSSRPSRKPSQSPSRNPSSRPSRKPSAKPSLSAKPSRKPSSRPSRKPSSKPSSKPSRKPSAKPSKMPTAADTCFLPTDFPILGIVFTVICLIIDIFT